MSSQRIERVNELMRRELGVAILRDAPGVDVARVTITRVETAPNLRTARVYISVLGNDQERADVMRHMRQVRASLQSHIGSNLNLKYTPILRIVEDRSLQTGGQVLDILNALEPTNPSCAPDALDNEPEQ
ncbi:MAG: 30S ribosome-binding factor RbfA [Verrucomicrobia bacterium]|nr:30S ribosome-binding factor RbfA [Verrucomicrobiota bacterium]